MTNSLRTFIAIELTASIQKELEEIQRHLQRAKADVKWVAPNNIHLTLKFLGDTSTDQIEKLKSILSKITSPYQNFSMEINKLGVFPKPEYPKVIWVGISSGGEKIVEIVQKIEDDLQILGFAKEKRDFSPHITLGRVRSPLNKSPLIKTMQNFSFLQPLQQTVQAIRLIKSTLTAQGPIYETIETFRFNN